MTADAHVAPYRPHRFDDAVEHYVAYRLRYPASLIERVVREAALAPNALVLDLGCGPGFLAEAFAPFAGEVIGIDPSSAMLAAAQRSAPPNVRYVEGSSYDLGAVPARVGLVTMGRSFHWMDRAQTLESLDALVSPGGTIALFGDSPIDGPKTAWWRAAQAVAIRHAKMDECAKLRRSDAWEPHESILLSSPFCDLARVGIFAEHVWSRDAIIGNILSRSATTEALLGESRTVFEDELDAALAPFGPGPWTSVNEHTALLARRPTEGQRRD